jgi:hypothetical protein
LGIPRVSFARPADAEPQDNKAGKIAVRRSLVRRQSVPIFPVNPESDAGKKKHPHMSAGRNFN